MKVRVHTTVDIPVDPSDLRDWRKAKGWTLRRTATLLGVTNSYWSKVERGETEPGAETFTAAVKLLREPEYYNTIQALLPAITAAELPSVKPTVIPSVTPAAPPAVEEVDLFKESLPPVSEAEQIDADFKVWYAKYPRRKGPAAAKKSYISARKKKGVTAGLLLAACERYVAETKGKEARFIKHPSTWLNQECWDDEPDRDRSSVDDVQEMDFSEMVCGNGLPPGHYEVPEGEE